MPTASARGAALTAVNPSRVVGFGFNVSATALKNRAPAWWECRRAVLDKGALFRCQGQWIVGHS